MNREVQALGNMVGKKEQNLHSTIPQTLKVIEIMLVKVGSIYPVQRNKLIDRAGCS